MFGLFDKIEEFFKELLIEYPTNLEDMFIDINDKLGQLLQM